MKLNRLMNEGIGNIMKAAGRFYLRNSQGRAMLSKMIPALQKSAALREAQERKGLHVPAFLIASVTSQCNLRCAGCYARAGGACGGNGQVDLTAEQWRLIFQQAGDLGVSFLLLAGGEPLLRPDVLALAADFPHMLFPVFTNGTMLNEAAVGMFDRHRNLIPILSIEGGQPETDARRGPGTYDKIAWAMKEMKSRRLLFGASVTVSRENRALVTDEAFAASLREQGSGLLLYVEYVPAEAGTEHLVLGDQELEALQVAVSCLKRQFDDMIVLSFPGDEAAMGGCLASGRGFFHINANGSAEPCPFAPYSKYNLKETSIQTVLTSDYFQSLQHLAATAEHIGGCTLFAHRDQVEELLVQ